MPAKHPSSGPAGDRTDLDDDGVDRTGLVPTTPSTLTATEFRASITSVCAEVALRPCVKHVRSSRTTARVTIVPTPVYERLKTLVRRGHTKAAMRLIDEVDPA